MLMCLYNILYTSLKTCHFLMALPQFHQPSVVVEDHDFVPDWAEILPSS